MYVYFTDYRVSGFLVQLSGSGKNNLAGLWYKVGGYSRFPFAGNSGKL